MGAVLQVWYVGFSQIVASCTSLIVLWVLLSCSNVYLSPSLVVTWCSSSFADVLSQFATKASLELRQGTQSSSHVVVVPPVEMQQGAWGPFELWCAKLGFLSSCTWGVGPPLELRQATWGSSQVATGYLGL